MAMRHNYHGLWIDETIDGRGNDVHLSRYKGKVLLIVNVASQWFDFTSNHKQEEQAVDLGVEVVKRATVKKGGQVAKIPNPRAAAAAENIKERKAAVKLGTEESVNVKRRYANVIIISTETSNGRAVKERSRKKKTGGGPTFTSLLTARSKEAAAIGGVARKRVDLIIVNIDEASGDDELVVAEYAEDIYKFYKLTERESQVCDYMGKQPDINERMRSIL
ncbi:hypothetical protein Dimus_028691, partial [Dionaea muscipula]